jgi:hypothetical protein
MAAGSSLASFLSGIQTVESPIGGIREGSKDPLIVSGLQLCKGADPILILSQGHVTIERTQPLSSKFDSSIAEIFGDYIKASGDAEGESKKQLLRAILTNKRLIVPFELGAKCIVNGTVAHNSCGGRSGTIDSIKWYHGKEDGKMHCCIITSVIGAMGGKSFKDDITNYGKTFKLADIHRVSVDVDGMYDYISMTRHGFIKPIVILKDKSRGMAIDNLYIYKFNKTETKIVGRWGNGLNIDANDKDLDELLEFVGEQTLKLIARHKRLIAPFMLAEANIIKKYKEHKKEESA